MILGDIARVTRGVVTGNAAMFIMSRERARDLGIERFTKPVIAGARAIPDTSPPIIRNSPSTSVVLLASRRDVEEHAELHAYLGSVAPRLASVRISPIAASYVGVPRFVANPDGLVITNALYAVTPRQEMSPKDILALVERLNDAMKKLPRTIYATRRTPRELESVKI